VQHAETQFVHLRDLFAHPAPYRRWPGVACLALHLALQITTLLLRKDREQRPSHQRISYLHAHARQQPQIEHRTAAYLRIQDDHVEPVARAE
jgi:hypothetical protein